MDRLITVALYHFTCKHGKKDIGTSNCLLIPHLHPWLGVKVLWLTTESVPDREATGLTMRWQKCDRLAFRYIVDDLSECRPWLESPERSLADEHLRDFELEGSDPEHWWVSRVPVKARFDRDYRIYAGSWNT